MRPGFSYVNLGQKREAYGENSKDTPSTALLRAIYSSVLRALYGHHSKDLRSLNIMVGK